MNNLILETKNLTKMYKREKVVDEISLKVEENSIYGILGPNGAGKSTTLKMITGMIKKTSGEILFCGHEFKRDDLENIGALIETPPIYENLTARENLKVRTLLLGLPDSRIDEVLSIVNLKDTGNKRSGNFSLGMKQRLGIATALINNPKLLILDEPTNGLDPVGIQELRDLIKSFPSKGITVIFASHNLFEVEIICDHVGIICEGKLLYQEKNIEGENLEEIFMNVIREGKTR